MIELLDELDKYVNKYVDIAWGNDEGASGWVIAVGKSYEVTETDENGPEKVEGRDVDFDWGMRVFVTHDSTIKEVEPPVGDTGPFKM